MPLLEIDNLSVDFPSAGGVLRAVDGVSLSVEEGEVLGIVGESGSGKERDHAGAHGPRRRARPRPGRPPALPGPGSRRPAAVAGAGVCAGRDMAMIFQEPTTSLNPCFTVGFQLAETLRLHLGLDRTAAHRARWSSSDTVGIPDPSRRLAAIRISSRAAAPARDDRHGAGLRAGAADRRRADHRARRHDPGPDPRPAARLARERGMSLVLITHDLGVVA